MNDELYDEINQEDEVVEEFAGLSDISADEVNKSFINNEFSDNNTSPMIGEVSENDTYKPVSFEAEENPTDSIPEEVEQVKEQEVVHEDVSEIMNQSMTVSSDNDISAGVANDESNKLSEMAYEEVMDEIKGNPVSLGQENYKCSNCSVVFAGTSICPFCGVEREKVEKDPNDRTPDLIIPFKIDKEEAIKMFKKENKLRLLTPFGYKRKVKKSLVGMYLPYYLFDVSVSGAVLYKARDITRTEDDKFQYKERKNYMVKLSGNFDFEKVLLDVCDKFPDKLNDYIFPFNLEEATTYDENIIDKYTIVRGNIADEEMANRIKNKTISESIAELNKSVRHDKMMVENNVLKSEVKSFKYIMLPIYLSMISYKGKKYVYCINGSSGKYISRVPLDSTKTIVLGLILLLLFFFIGLGIAFII